ncbi:MAG: putative quinol monooxygenase [Solirubrobacteraceae bacterium]|jgi:quinol monooxygenase YgiN
MPEVVLIAKFVAKEGSLAELLDVFEVLAPRIQAEEPGCLRYAVHTAAGEPAGTVVMVEAFASADAYDEHRASPTMAEFGPVLAALVDRPIEVTLLEPVAIGDSAKGRVGG